MPQELIECWTLEERSLKGSLHHMPPVHKRYVDLHRWLNMEWKTAQGFLFFFFGVCVISDSLNSYVFSVVAINIFM